MAQAGRDSNFVTTLLALSSADGTTPIALWADPTTHRLLVDIPGGAGTVTSVSVATANGFAGTVATATSTPAITLSTTLNTPIIAGNGTALIAATTTGSGSTVVLNNSPVFVDDITVGVAASATGSILFKGTTSGTVTLSVADVAGTWTLKLPTTDGNNLEFLQTDGSGNTSWVAGTTVAATTITVANEATDVSCFPVFVTAATGDLGPKSNTSLTFNSNTALLTSTLLAATTSVTSASILASSNDSGALGAAGTAFSDLFLAEGGVINWDSGDVTITQTGNVLAFAGASTSYSFDALVQSSVAAVGLRVVNTTDNAAVQVAKFEGDRATPTDADLAYVSYLLSDSAGTQTEIGRFTWEATDVTIGTNVDGILIWSVVTADTLAQELTLSGASLSPSTDDGLTLGVAEAEWSDLFLAEGGVINWDGGDATLTQTGNAMAFAGITTLTSTGAINPSSNDAVALGAAGTAWSDLFLAEGGVINWDSSDMTLTQTSNELVLAGGNLDIGVGNILRLPVGATMQLSIPTSDGTATGPTTASFVSGYTSTAIGDLMYLDSSSKWQKTDADAIGTTTGLLGIALSVAATDAAVLVALPGSMVYATAFPTMTVGVPMYVDDTTPGAIKATIPTGADNCIRVVGFAIHADKLWFFPSSDNQTTVA